MISGAADRSARKLRGSSYLHVRLPVSSVPPRTQIQMSLLPLEAVFKSINDVRSCVLNFINEEKQGIGE